MRKKAITKLVSYTRMVGTNPMERLISDSKIIINIFFSKKKKNIKRKAIATICDFVSNVGLRHLLNIKVREMEERSIVFILIDFNLVSVINIQRKWRDLTKRKIFFSMLIRNLWKEKFNQIFMSFRLEKSREPLSPKRSLY
jgi:hypothetical protein